MFKSLKKKLKKLVSSLKDSAETVETISSEDTEIEALNEPIKEVNKQKIQENKIEVYPTKKQETIKPNDTDQPKQPNGIKIYKKSLFSGFKEKITTTTFKEDKFLDIFEDIELELLKANVALEVVDALKNRLKRELVGKRFQRSKLDSIVRSALNNSISSLFESRLTADDLLSMINKKRAVGEPFVIVIMGVNGSGKTTTAAKLASFFLRHGLKPVFAASDTFRAAGIEQLQQHANALGIPLIKHNYKSDPAAVAYDAIQYAKAKGLDIVIIDTAGRLHSNRNLMEELKKVVRVAKPDIKIFVGEAITGNDCVQQAKLFNKVIGIDAIILAKADVDDKGGAVLSVSYITKKPLIFLGVGQSYDALQDFNADNFVNTLLN